MSSDGSFLEYTFRAFRGEYDVTVLDEEGREVVASTRKAAFEVKEDTVIEYRI